MSKKGKIKKRPLRVLFLPVDESGCGWYRIRQFHDMFLGRKDVESILLTGKEEPETVLEAIKECDIVIARTADYSYVKEIKEKIDQNKVVVLDHDDNTFLVPPTSQHYKDFGTRNVYMRDEKTGEVIPIWVSGKTKGFNRYRNLSIQTSILYLLGACDYITAPTEHLLESLLQKSGNPEKKGAVVHNALDFDLYPEGKFIPKEKSNMIKLGWHGGVSHLGDWIDILEQLTEVMEENKDVELHMFGSNYPPQFKPFIDRVHFHRWLPFRGYTLKIKTLALDGAIIPLSDDPFNQYKSEIKFVEFNQLGVPCVVKNALPYSVVAKDGENCWGYKDPAEFKEKLQAMIDDIRAGGKKGAEFVEKMQAFNKENRDLKKEAEQLRETYKSFLPEDVQREIM